MNKKFWCIATVGLAATFSLPLPALARLALAVALTGFGLAATSGLLMFASQPMELLANRVFTLKMLLLMAAGSNAAWFHGRGSLRFLGLAAVGDDHIAAAPGDAQRGIAAQAPAAAGDEKNGSGGGHDVSPRAVPKPSSAGYCRHHQAWTWMLCIHLRPGGPDGKMWR